MPFRLSCVILLSTLLCFSARANDTEVLLFEDEFERNESQEEKDEIGNDWGTNSATRAGGNKQADLRDGHLHVFKHATADHGVSVKHPVDFKDCRIQLRFRLDHKRDDIGIDFADMKCREVHAGHICKVMFRPSQIEILDFKNGRMKKSYRDAAKAGTLTQEQKQAVTAFSKKFSHTIELNRWHDLEVTIRKDTLAVVLDGKPVASFASPGMDHPQKNMLRFSASREFRMDDIKVFALKK